MPRQRLPLTLSITALVVAVFGSTPIGHATAARIVPFARNADTVDHVHASRAPKPGRLLVLDNSAKVPAAALPAPSAPAVTRGWARYGGPLPSAVGEIIHLPIGNANVIVNAKAAFQLARDYSPYDLSSNARITCQLAVGTETDQQTFVVPSYTQGPASGSLVVPFEVVAHAAGPRTATLSCLPTSLNSGSGRVSVQSVRISAIEVDDLTNSKE